MFVDPRPFDLPCPRANKEPSGTSNATARRRTGPRMAASAKTTPLGADDRRRPQPWLVLGQVRKAVARRDPIRSRPRVDLPLAFRSTRGDRPGHRPSVRSDPKSMMACYALLLLALLPPPTASSSSLSQTGRTVPRPPVRPNGLARTPPVRRTGRSCATPPAVPRVWHCLALRPGS